MKKPLYTIKEGVKGVRLALEKDEADIFALLLMMHAEIGFFSLNREKVIQAIQFGTQLKGGVIYVIDADDRVVASLGMLPACDWYSDDVYMLERWNYVHPEYRKRGQYGHMLLEQGKWTTEYFKSQGLSRPFQCGLYTLDRTEAKVRLYARHMACVGASFMYGRPPRQQAQMDAELERIKQAAAQKRKERSERVNPTVETIIRVSREAENKARATEEAT